jgi:Carboxypeptidase regulatory-like domain
MHRQTMHRLFGLLISILMSCAAWAQTTAQMSGTIKDQTGAVLPGAEVTVTQTDTGLTRNAVTDETGSYVLTNLPVGPYKFEAGLPGFRTYIQTGIVLQVNSNPTVNAVLEVGQITDQVEVQADAALVETRSTGIGQVIDNVRVLELPLNGRNVTELIYMIGAAVGGGNQMTNRNYPTESISVAGGMNNGLTFLLDGGTHNDPFNGLGLPLPFPDALQEFKVETSAVPAQYGQHSAGAINAVTKSGTNNFHGDLFEFVRNGKLNARNAFALKRDSLKRNQYGGTLGGPVIQNRLFFFGGYQGTKQRSEPTDLFAYIPTPAMLAGDWTTITSPACNQGRQINLRAPFVNNRIDPALFAVPAVNVTKIIPTTSDPCGQIRFGRKTNSDENVYIAKVDYQWTQKHSVFTRYQYNRLFTPTNYDRVNPISMTEADYTRIAQSAIFGDTYLIGTGTVSTFRATMVRTYNNKTFDQNIGTWGGSLGVKNFYVYPGVAKIPLLTVAGGFTIGSAPGMPGFGNSTVGQVSEDISTQRGAHQIGFGANYIYSRLYTSATTSTSGNFNFSATNTGMGLGDFMTGQLNTVQQQGITTWYQSQPYYGLYLQDTWKANSHLTLNGGVRWEPYHSMREKLKRFGWFDKAAFDKGIHSTVFKNAPAGMLYPGDPGVPNTTTFGPNYYLKRFVPRVGLAWDPHGDGHMTVRASYGIFFDYPHLYAYGDTRDEAPFGGQVTLTAPPGGFADPWNGIPGGNPFPFTLGANAPFPASAAQYYWTPQDVKPPYANQWGLSIQRQFGADWLLAANYVGSNVIHVANGYEVNPVVYLPGASCVIAGRTYSPCSSTSNTQQRRLLALQDPVEGARFGDLRYYGTHGTRTYNGMLLSVQRRRSNGLTLQVNYTYAHCIEDPLSDPKLRLGAPNERRYLDRGNCVQDRRHNFNSSTVYETPQFSNGVLRKLATGWKISGILRILSGDFMTVTPGQDNALQTGLQRPNLVMLDVYGPGKTTNNYLNPAAFAQSAPGTFGNLGEKNIQGPGSIRIDMGLTRAFQIREGQSLEFRVEAFNLPNHLNPLDPTLVLTNANFGKIQSAADPRIMQLALKYVF